MILKQAGTQLVEDLPPSLVADMKRLGVFRCAVVQPDCDHSPVVHFTDGKLKDDRGKLIYRLLCRKHARYFCIRAGMPVPVYLKDDN